MVITHATVATVYVTGPEKTGFIYLSTQNTLVYSMECISCSVYAIQKLLLLLNSSWISAHMMTFQIQYRLRVKRYYILNCQNQDKILCVDKTGCLRPSHIFSKRCEVVNFVSIMNFYPN